MHSHRDRGSEGLQVWERVTVDRRIGKVIDNGQTVLLPPGLEVAPGEYEVRRSGDGLVLTPVRTGWEGFLKGFPDLSNDFIVEGGLGEDAPRESFD